MPDAPGMALQFSLTASQTNWSSPSTVTSSVVLTIHVDVALLFVTLAMSRCARLDEFRLAGPEVHVVKRLASEALQLRRELRYAHGLYLLHSSKLLKHCCCAYVAAADMLNSGGGGGGGLGGSGLGGGGLGGGGEGGGGLGGGGLGGGGEGGGGLGGGGLGGGLGGGGLGGGGLAGISPAARAADAAIWMAG